MELTFACPSCGLVGQVSGLETVDCAVCRRCGNGRPLHAEAIVDSRLEACPWCLGDDLYIQKDFPQALGLAVVVTQFAVSTVFWYYEMVLATFSVLIGSAAPRLGALSQGAGCDGMLPMFVPGPRRRVES